MAAKSGRPETVMKTELKVVYFVASYIDRPIWHGVTILYHILGPECLAIWAVWICLVAHSLRA